MERLLPVVECFHSLQGEGKHVGKSAFFIRLASCKVGCPWCDTKESWSTDNHPKETISNLAEYAVKAQTLGAKFLVLTGGEPLHHNLNYLCTEIRQATFQKNNELMPIHIETSGVDPLSGNPDWITVSPKRHAPPRIDVLHACHELKVVIHSKDDLEFAEKMAHIANQSSLNTQMYLQPGWQHVKGQKLAYEYVKRHSQWRLSMQTHKWLGIL